MHVGAQSRGLRAPCERFAPWVTPGPRITRFRLAADLGRMGLDTHRVSNKVSKITSRHLVPLDRAFPAHAMVHGAEQVAADAKQIQDAVRRGVTAELVRDQTARGAALALQQRPEESCGSVPMGSGRPGSLLTLAPHRSGRAGSAASGSSTDSVATRRPYPLVQEARRWPPPSLRLVWPVRLSVVVTWRRDPTSVCWPSFPPTVPPAGAPFPPRGLVGAIPPLRRCRVGGGAHQRARLRPPLKRYVPFSGIPLSQGCLWQRDGRYQRDQVNKTILAVELALGESPVAPASPPLIAMGMDTPNDPAIQPGEERADMGLAKVIAPPADDRVDLIDERLRRHRSLSTGQLADLVLEVVDGLLPWKRIHITPAYADFDLGVGPRLTRIRRPFAAGKGRRCRPGSHRSGRPMRPDSTRGRIAGSGLPSGKSGSLVRHRCSTASPTA